MDTARAGAQSTATRLSGARSRPVLIAIGLVLLIGGGMAVAITSLAGGTTDPGTAKPGSSAGRPAAPQLRRVDPATITAKASSTLEPGSRSYRAANTLDGRDETAWNSDGDRDGDGVGIELTWAFEKGQDVRQITVRNGYVRSLKYPDVWEWNGRIKRVKVTADGTSTEWTLKDTKDPQTLRFDLGVTRQVRFEVLEIYPGSKYDDLALTDIAFSAAQ